MKKTLLATAILSGLVSATAGATTVYEKDGTKLEIGGRAEVRGVFGNDVDGTMEDKSRARINFGGETQISENLTGFGFVEYELSPEAKGTVDDLVNTDSGYYLSSRYIYVGLGTQFGDFSYGKQDTANVQISDFTDIASNHSGEQQVIDAASDKQSNTFLYSHTFADALTVQADYQAVENKDMDAFGLSAAYAFDFGLDLGVAYSDQDDSNQLTAGAAYTFEDLYVAATYAMGDIDKATDFDSLELAVQYKVTKELRLIGIYANVQENSDDTTEYYALEAQYRFNSTLRTYASYQLNQMDGGEDELMVGLRYNF